MQTAAARILSTAAWNVEFSAGERVPGGRKARADAEAAGRRMERKRSTEYPKTEEGNIVSSSGKGEHR
tara:strand:- start:79 stop:282 length:204 start_codon:yes stop_codon:yes gene_type:complete